MIKRNETEVKPELQAKIAAYEFCPTCKRVMPTGTCAKKGCK